MTTSVSAQDVARVAAVAKVTLTPDEQKSFADGFTATLAVVDKFNELDVSKTPPTHHVTGEENDFRDDVVDEKRMFTQEEALANAPRSYNGFFVVDQVIEQ